jgi:hypothetical protein
MELGNFSVSLAVNDLKASRAFHKKLGFTVFAADESSLCDEVNSLSTRGSTEKTCSKARVNAFGTTLTLSSLHLRPVIE